MSREKRPPRQVWCLINHRGVAVGVYSTKKAAAIGMETALGVLRLVGPFVLAERVRQK